MCKSIEESETFNTRFNKKEINLSRTSLSATDLECLSLFLTSSSHEQWEGLNLLNCYIQDRGLYNIYKHIKHSDNHTIRVMRLSNNGLTSSSSSFIKDIVLSCTVEVLVIGGS